AAEDVDLVDDDHDLLAPVPDLLHERTFGLGERTIRGCDEQHQVRARDEARGEPLVLPYDGIGARCVDDVDLPEQRGWRGHGDEVRLHLPRGSVGAVLQHRHLRRRWRDAFLHHLLAGERVDERALAGIEFPDDHEEEQLVELRDGSLERREVFVARAEPDQSGAEIVQNPPLLAEDLFFSRTEYALEGHDVSANCRMGAGTVAAKSAPGRHSTQQDGDVQAQGGGTSRRVRIAASSPSVIVNFPSMPQIDRRRSRSYPRGPWPEPPP